MSAREFWRQAFEIMRKDLKVEGRAGEVLSITVPFGAAALLLLPLAIGTEKTMLSRIGPGMFFAVMGIIILGKSLRQATEVFFLITFLSFVACTIGWSIGDYDNASIQTAERPY